MNRPIILRVFTDPDDRCDHQYDIDSSLPLPNIGDVMPLHAEEMEAEGYFSGVVTARHFSYGHPPGGVMVDLIVHPVKNTEPEDDQPEF